MANVFKPKRSSTAAKVPTTTDLASGEIGVNMADQKVYINNGTSVVQVGTGKISGAADVTITSPTSGQVLSWNGTAWVNAAAGSGSVTGVTATAPVVSSGGSAPVISMAAATASVNGYMTSTYAAKLDGIASGATANTGTVTSVSGTGTASGLTLSGTVTTSGNLTLSGTVNSLAAGSYGISVTGSSASCTGNAATATSSPLLSALGNYTWSASTTPTSFNQGVQASFVSASQGFQSYGSVMTVNTYSGGGGALQMFVPYSPTYGGTGLQVRFGNYDVSSGNSWTSWKTLLASDNYTSYAMPAGSSATNSVDVRAPIFYDSNNTSYYVDPTGTTRISTIYCGDVYNDLGGWFRNYGATGIYNQSYGCHFYAESGAYWNLTAAGGASVGLKLRATHNSTVYGWIYADSSLNCGFLSDAGSWRARIVGNDYWQVDGSSCRAPLYYDTNDTSYYVDPNSTSVLYRVGSYYLSNNGAVSTDQSYGMYFDSGLSTAYAIFRESGAWVSPYPNLRIAFHTGISIGANASYGGTNFFTDYDMATYVMSVNNSSYVSGGVYVHTDLRAPIMYDANNTGYYCDPASTSNFNAVAAASLTVNGGSVAVQSAGGVVLENGQTISSNYTMTSGKNGSSAGPITIATGVTVTIPTGSNWVIV